MTMKKVAILTLAAIAVLLCGSCTTSAPKRASVAAEGFLKASFAMDYEEAASFCTPSYADLVRESAQRMENVSQALMQKMKEASSETSFRIVSVKVNDGQTEATVEVLVKAPGLEREVPKTVRLLFEGGAALVDAVE